MGLVIILRHGETAWNSANRVLGRTDVTLSKEGVLQAQEAKNNLSMRELSCIYSSPLIRAKHTSSVIADDLLDNVIVDNRLIEQDFGIFEGVQRDDPEYLKAKHEFFSRYPEGESFQDVAARVYPFIEEIKEKHKDETVLVVTHNGICRVIANYFTDMTNEEFVSFSMGNCEIREFKF